MLPTRRVYDGFYGRRLLIKFCFSGEWQVPPLARAFGCPCVSTTAYTCTWQWQPDITSSSRRRGRGAARDNNSLNFSLTENYLITGKYFTKKTSARMVLNFTKPGWTEQKKVVSSAISLCRLRCTAWLNSRLFFYTCNIRIQSESPWYFLILILLSKNCTSFPVPNLFNPRLRWKKVKRKHESQTVCC